MGPPAVLLPATELVWLIQAAACPMAALPSLAGTGVEVWTGVGGVEVWGAAACWLVPLGLCLVAGCRMASLGCLKPVTSCTPSPVHAALPLLLLTAAVSISVRVHWASAATPLVRHCTLALLLIEVPPTPSRNCCDVANTTLEFTLGSDPSSPRNSGSEETALLSPPLLPLLLALSVVAFFTGAITAVLLTM